MARITKDINTEGSRLNTGVLASQTDLGNISNTNSKDAARIKQLISLTPGIAGIIQNATLIAKEQEEKEAINMANFRAESAKIDKERKIRESEVIKGGTKAFELGQTSNQIADPDSRTYHKALNDLVPFNETWKSKIKDGIFNNVKSSQDLKKIYNKDREDYIEKLGLPDDMSGNPYYVLAGEQSALEQQKINELTFNKAKTQDEIYQTDQSIGSATTHRIGGIMNQPNDKVKNMEWARFFKNGNELIGKDLQISISKKDFNNKNIETIEAMIDSGQISPDEYAHIRLGASAPYETGRPEDSTNDDVKNKNSFLTANQKAFARLDNKIGGIKAQGIKKNAVIIDRVLKDENIKLAAKSQASMIKARQTIIENGGTDGDLDRFDIKVNDRAELDAKQYGRVERYLLAKTQADMGNLRIDFDSLEEADQDETLNKTLEAVIKGPLTNVEQYSNPEVLEASIEISNRMGKMIPVFKSVLDRASFDLKTDSARYISDGVTRLIADGWSKADLSASLGLETIEINGMISLSEIYKTEGDPKKREERIEELNKRMRNNTDTNFKIELEVSGNLEEYNSGNDIDDILEYAGIEDDDPFRPEAKRIAKIQMRDNFMISKDYKNSIVEAKRLLKGEFIKVGENTIRANNDVKKMGTDIVSEHIKTSLGNINDVLFDIDNDVKTTFNPITAFFQAKDYLTDDIGLTYDPVKKMHFLSEGGSFLPVNRQRHEVLMKSDNIETNGQKYYLKDLTQPIFFLDDTDGKNGFDFKENNSIIMKTFKHAYGKTKLDEKFNSLIERRIKTDKINVSANIDDIESAIDNLNTWNVRGNLRNWNVSVFNKYASIIANEKIEMTDIEWKTLLNVPLGASKKNKK
jgi:hypothetical protein